MLFKYYTIILFIIAVKIFGVQSAFCNYQLTVAGYFCTLTTENILNENDMLNIRGEHLSGYEDQNVTRLLSTGITVQVFPSSIINTFTSLDSVILYSSNMRTFMSPINNCQHLTILDLDSNEISSVPGEIFRNCNQLRYLSMENNFISNIDNNAFAGLSQLNELSLTNNSVRTLNSYIFSSLTSLVHLSLDNNDIENLPVVIFESCQLLETLDLTNNKITTWNSAILNDNPNLKTLQLGGNQIRSIDGSTFANLQNLVNLSVGGLLQRIPTFFNLGQLEYLSLSNNLIRNVSADSFRSLANLRVLNLQHNEIESVNFNHRQDNFLTLLTNLHLGNNNLRTSLIDNTFSMLVSLATLDLSQNKLESLNELSIRPITQMRTLDVSDNQIRRIERKLFDGVTSLDF